MSAAAIGGIIASAFAELATGVVEKLTGKHPDEEPNLKALVERVVRDAMNAGIQQLEERLRTEVAALGLVFEIRHLGDVIAGADAWFRPKDPRGGLVERTLEGAQIEILPPEAKLTPFDEFDNSDTPVPDGSSER